LALSSRREPNWVRAAAARKTPVPKTQPNLLTVKGMERMPDPITVLMMVVMVSAKSG
jgi:hypothetical protein